jgi:hypothetical protein
VCAPSSHDGWHGADEPAWIATREDEMADSPGVVPMIAYEDGFTERTRLLDADGRVSHGEMDTGYGPIMLASPGSGSI